MSFFIHIITYLSSILSISILLCFINDNILSYSVGEDQMEGASRLIDRACIYVKRIRWLYSHRDVIVDMIRSIFTTTL